jgi:hypothetical protein
MGDGLADEWRRLCNLPVSILTLVRIVAANWSLRTHVEASKPGRPYTFFSAKTAVTFNQLSKNLRKCALSVAVLKIIK